MKRPFRDIRPFGPFFADYSSKITVPDRVPPGADEYIATVHLSGLVLRYKQEKTQFASFVKAAFKQHGLFYDTYRGGSNESPYKGDKYFCKVKTVELPSPDEIDSIIDMINDKVADMSAPEFRVENIEFELNQ